MKGYKNNLSAYTYMEWIDDTFEAQSTISGNIEITFNSKNLDFDEYEPIQEQLVLTIGKSGRANRLTFEELKAKNLREAGETLLEIAEQLQVLEDFMEEAMTDEFDIDRIESLDSEQKNRIQAVKDYINDHENEEVEIEELKESLDIEKEKVAEIIEKLKREGDLFEPKQEFIQVTN